MSVFVLKLIALLAMLCDHVGYVFSPFLTTGHYYSLRFVGRVAFPIFVFFTAEGCRRTSNIKLYLLRLEVFALISEIPFDLAFARFVRSGEGVLGVYEYTEQQSVFVTLFLGVLCVWLFQEFNKGVYSLVYIALIPCVIWLGGFLKTDYGSAGVLAVFALYLLPYGKREPGKPWGMGALGKFRRIAALFVLLLYIYIFDRVDWVYARRVMADGGFASFVEFMPSLLYDKSVEYLMYGCISLFLLAFYNNKRGAPQKWLFYVGYPSHLLILGILRYIFVLS